MYLLVETFSCRNFFNQTTETTSRSAAQSGARDVNKLSSENSNRLDLSIATSTELHDTANCLCHRNGSTDSSTRNEVGLCKNIDALETQHPVNLSACSSSQSLLGINMSTHMSRLCRHLCYVSLVLWLLWFLSSSLIQPTSRRLANLAYVLIVLAVSTSMMYFVILVDILGGVDVRVMTLEYMNRSQLFVFLGSNLLTGAVNLSMKTIYAPRWLALSVLTAYTIIIVCCTWLYRWVMPIDIQ